jgi:anti-anti-sigma factor
MNFKIDTKERMHVITVEQPDLAANMTEELEKELTFYLSAPIKNLVINLENVKQIDESIARTLVNIQQDFYDANNSLVFCKLRPEVENYLESIELLEIMNVTPTVSEASDIVQMEEIEREFL